MRSLSYSTRSTISYEEVEQPSDVGADEVLVRPAFTGICGTDLLIWHNGHSRATPPVTLGHEFSGVVERVGADVDDIAPGDRVVVEPLLNCGACEPCNRGDYNQCSKLRLLGVDVDGSLADVVLAPASRVFRIPDGLSLRDAAFVEPVAVVAHLIARVGGVRAGQVVFVAGGGPIGLIAAELAHRAGANVFVAEQNSFRADVAERLGATVVRDLTVAAQTVREQTGTDGADICIEATGVAIALQACIDAARPGAVVGVVGLPKTVPATDITQIIGKEIDLRGSRVYTRVDFEAALSYVTEGQLTLSEHITHVMPFEDAIARGFEAIERGEAMLKVVIDQERAGG